jgi:hypothetical protein
MSKSADEKIKIVRQVAEHSEEPVNERQVNGEIFVHDLGAVVPVVKPRRPDLTTQSARNAVRGSTHVARLAGR